MKKISKSEKLLIEEISQSAKMVHQSIRGLKIGEFVKLIRSQLKMSQKALAKRAKIPQSTVSRIEHNLKEPNLSTISKIFNALSCKILIAPILKESIDNIRSRQAKLIAKKHIEYLKGTMHLEKQKPDNTLLEELRKQEEEELLQGSGTKLWES